MEIKSKTMSTLESNLADKIGDNIPSLSRLGSGDCLTYAAKLLMNSIKDEFLAINDEKRTEVENAIKTAIGGWADPTDDEKIEAVIVLLQGYLSRMKAENEEAREHWAEVEAWRNT